MLDCRLFLTTWNMHGKRPPKHTDLSDLLFGSDAKQPRKADIYGLGCVRSTAPGD